MKLLNNLRFKLAQKFNPVLVKELVVILKENEALKIQLDKEKFLKEQFKEELKTTHERLEKVTRSYVDLQLKEEGLKPISASRLSALKTTTYSR